MPKKAFIKNQLHTFDMELIFGNTVGVPSLTIKLKNINVLRGKIFTITYNPNDIAFVPDLCRMTYRKETSVGSIQETGITILQHSPGVIKFTVDKNVPEGKVWSGVVNIIQFKSAVSGQVTLTCKVE